MATKAVLPQLITLEVIEKLKTRAGGWTRRDLALLGVPWPPVSGWKDRIIGNEMSPALIRRLSIPST